MFTAVLLLLFVPNVRLLAQQQDANKPAGFFEMPLEELMNVEVASTATLTETKPRLVPATMTTITAEQIQASGARSLYELLDIYVPNLEWLRQHYEPDVMGLRGIIGDRNDKYLLLVNGRNMNEHTHFGALTEQDLVMLSDIDHIDVIRGPGSALYGPGAVSMVINIVTFNAATFEGTEVTNRLGAVEEFYSTEVKHGQKFKDGDGGIFIYTGVSDYVGASKYDAPQIYPFTFPTHSSSKYNPSYIGPPAGSLPGDGIQAGEPATGVVNRDEAEAGPTPLKLYAEITKGNWDIWLRYTQSGKEFAWSTESLARTRWGYGENFTTDVTSKVPWIGVLLPWNFNYYTYQQATGYVGYKQELAANLGIDYAFSYSMTDYERFFDDSIHDDYREDEYYAKALLHWQPNDKNKIAFGAELTHLNLGLKNPSTDMDATYYISNSVQTMPQWSTDMYSLLGEWQWNINDQWTTFLGARLDKHTFTDYMFSPRAAVIYTPNDKDTYKLMWSQSLRANYEEEMKAQYDAGGGLSKPEKLDSIELRYERQQSKNLDLAASVFVHYSLQAIAWDPTTYTSSLSGTQREYGIELEASYHTDKTRLTISHGFTKLYGYYLPSDLMTSLPNPPAAYVTMEPYGYGYNLTNWSTNITKLAYQRKLDDKWTLNGSLRIYWGFPGLKDFDEYYPYAGSTAADHRTYAPFTSWPIVEDGWDRAYLGSYWLDIGLQYKPNKNLTIGINGYNLLGIFNSDFNKRNYVNVGSAGGDYRSAAPAIGVSLTYKF
jgi:iron complex outermembrane receptor protein